MKLKYIIASLLTTVFFAMGCTQEPWHTLEGIKVSTSYIDLPSQGGAYTIIVTATTDWAFDTTSDEDGQSPIPEWLTISPMSGTAGETEVTFSAGATEANNDVTLKLIGGVRHSCS